MSINVGNLQGSLSLEDQLSDALDKIHDRLTLAGVDFDTLSGKIVSSSNTLKQAANTQIVLQTELTKTQQNTATLRGQMEQLAEWSNKNAGAAKALAPALSAVSEEYLRSKSASDALRASMKDLDQQFNTITESSKVSSQQIVAFGRGLQEAGTVLSGFVTVPLVAAGAAVLGFSSQFEKASTKVVALAGVSREEVDSLKGSVLNLSTVMGVVPAEIEKGLFVVESAGFRGAKAMDILTTSSKMTAVGMGDMEETTRAVVGAMLTYQKEGLTAAQVGDIFTKTVQLGNMKVDDLVGALARVSPVAAAMHVKFSDVNAAIATFTHLGASTDVAATGIRAVLSTILNDGAKTEKGLKALNISMSDLRQEIEQKGLTQALLHLVDAASKIPGGMDKLQQVFPNIRALTLVLADAVSQSDNYQQITEKLRDGSSALNEAFGATKETWAQQINEITAAGESFAIQLGQDLLPVLKEFTTFFKDYFLPTVQYGVDVFTNLPVPIQLGVVAFGALLAVVGPTLIIVGEMIRSWGHLSALLTDTAFAEAAAGALKGLTVAMEGTSAASVLLASALPVALAVTTAATFYELYQVGKQLYDWWHEAEARRASDAKQSIADQNTIAEAMKIVNGPVRDVAEAIGILNENAARLREQNTFVGPQINEMDLAYRQLNETQKLAIAITDMQKQSVAELSPGVKELTDRLFDLGYSSAESIKFLKDHNLYLDEQKVLVENLHDVWRQHQKDLKEIAAAQEEVRFATIPLTDAQKEEADTLLKLGIGHQVIAREIGAHLSQVQALVKADTELQKAMKIEEEGALMAEKAWASYYEQQDSFRATDQQKVIAKAEKDYETHVAEAQKKGIVDVDYYNALWALRQQDIEQNNGINKKIYENSREYLQKQLQDAKDNLQTALNSGLRLSDGFKKELHDAIDKAQQKLDSFGKAASSMLTDVAGKVHLLSGEWVTLDEAIKRFNQGNSMSYDLSTEAGVESYRKANPGNTVSWSDQQIIDFIKKGGSLQDLFNMGVISPRGSGGLPFSGTGGPAQPPPTVPTTTGTFSGQATSGMASGGAIAGTGSGVVFQKGAFEFNYPIMKDPKALNELARIWEAATVSLLKTRGQK